MPVWISGWTKVEAFGAVFIGADGEANLHAATDGTLNLFYSELNAAGSLVALNNSEISVNAAINMGVLPAEPSLAALHFTLGTDPTINTSESHVVVTVIRSINYSDGTPDANTDVPGMYGVFTLNSVIFQGNGVLQTDDYLGGIATNTDAEVEFRPGDNMPYGYISDFVPSDIFTIVGNFAIAPSVNPIEIDHGTLVLTTDELRPMTVSGAGTITVDPGATAVISPWAVLTNSNTVSTAIANDGTLMFDPAGLLTLSSTISGAGVLSKRGAAPSFLPGPTPMAGTLT